MKAKKYLCLGTLLIFLSTTAPAAFYESNWGEYPKPCVDLNKAKEEANKILTSVLSILSGGGMTASSAVAYKYVSKASLVSDSKIGALNIDKAITAIEKMKNSSSRKFVSPQTLAAENKVLANLKYARYLRYGSALVGAALTAFQLGYESTCFRRILIQYYIPESKIKDYGDLECKVALKGWPDRNFTISHGKQYTVEAGVMQIQSIKCKNKKQTYENNLSCKYEYQMRINSSGCKSEQCTGS